MKQAMILFWQERDARERRLLAVLGVVLAATLAYLLVARPIEAYRQSAEQNLQAAEREQAMVADALRRTAAVRTAAPLKPVASLEALKDTVTASIVKTGLTVDRNAISGKGLELLIEAIDPAVLYPWLEELEREHGIYVANASISAIDSGAKVRARLMLGYRN